VMPPAPSTSAVVTCHAYHRQTGSDHVGSPRAGASQAPPDYGVGRPSMKNEASTITMISAMRKFFMVTSDDGALTLGT
jgi:hypothetical protein